MNIRFDPSFDGRSWPGPLGERDAVIGEVWVGRWGLLDLLETQLGLGGLRIGLGQRAAGLARRVREIEGFWSESAEVDAIGCARRLVSWRDELYLAGWRGQAAGERLVQLAAVTRGLEPGLPERIDAVIDAARVRSLDLEVIERLEPVDDLEAMWVRLFDALGERGVRIERTQLEAAPARGDLAAARSTGFRPRRDGSLQLIRPYGEGSAADEVAAWLAAQPNGQTVIIGSDPTLDDAVRRHGLPVTGAADPAYENHLLQLLPLVLGMGWDPIDPRRAAELLLHPDMPLQTRLRSRLADSLGRWPAVDSYHWREKAARVLDGIEEPDQRAKMEHRLRVLFTPGAKRRSEWPVSDLVARVELLADWLTRRATSAVPDADLWWSAAADCRALLDMIERTGDDSVTAPQVRRLVDGIVKGARRPVRRSAEAGVACVDRPGAIAGPADRILWWSFRLDSAPGFRTLPLTRDERAALAEHGVELVDPAVAAQAEARRWRRPLEQARGALLLVCPRGGPAGEMHPHPLWDELEAALDDETEVSRLIDERPFGRTLPARVARERRPSPQPRRAWPIDGALIEARATESASSLGALIGCSMRWALRYRGELYGGPSVQLSDGALLNGSVAHRLLELVFVNPPSTPDAAKRRAEEIFDREVPHLAAPLFLPGAEVERASLRRICVTSAADIARLLADADLSVHSVEEVHEGSLDGVAISSRPDMIAGSPPLVIDYKLGGLPYRRSDLRRNAAYQLALYAHLVREKTGVRKVTVGYYVLRSGGLVSSTDGDVRIGQPIEGASVDTMIDALVRGRREAWEILSGGLVEAKGIATEDVNVVKQDDVVEGQLQLAPECRYCDFELLCGRAFADES